MSWPQTESIRNGVVSMLGSNMGLKDGERVKVITDVLPADSWRTLSPVRLKEYSERTLLARLVYDISKQEFTGNPISFYSFSATMGHGTEPDIETAAQMKDCDVLIILTTYSMSHTNARERASEAGVRLASMPGFTADMFEDGGPLAVDGQQIARDCRYFADLLTAATDIRLVTPTGTDLSFSIAGRNGDVDDGIYSSTGVWGNLPAGEAFTTPLEGTAQGQLVAPAGWFPGLESDLIFTVVDGLVVRAQGGGAVGDEFRDLLQLDKDDEVFRRRRNMAELGIGTNPQAKRPDNVLEAEKIKGTVHIAIGDSIHLGGTVESDLHEDFIQPDVDLFLDGEKVIDAGSWKGR